MTFVSTTMVHIPSCALEMAHTLPLIYHLLVLLFLVVFFWEVHGDCCGSDRFPIIPTAAEDDVNNKPQRWKLKQADWNSFQEPLIVYDPLIKHLSPLPEQLHHQQYSDIVPLLQSFDFHRAMQVSFLTVSYFPCHWRVHYVYEWKPVFVQPRFCASCAVKLHSKVFQLLVAYVLLTEHVPWSA